MNLSDISQRRCALQNKCLPFTVSPAQFSSCLLVVNVVYLRNEIVGTSVHGDANSVGCKASPRFKQLSPVRQSKPALAALRNYEAHVPLKCAASAFNVLFTLSPSCFPSRSVDHFSPAIFQLPLSAAMDQHLMSLCESLDQAFLFSRERCAIPSSGNPKLLFGYLLLFRYLESLAKHDTMNVGRSANDVIWSVVINVCLAQYEWQSATP